MPVGVFMKTACSLLVYLFLVLNCFAAGWDTNAWSGDYQRYYLDASTNKVFIKEVLSSNAFEAIEERSAISGVSSATTNAWFRNNRSDLVNIKSWISANADEFYNGKSWTTNGWVINTSTNTQADLAWISCHVDPIEAAGRWVTSTSEGIDVGLESLSASAYSVSEIIDELNLSSNYFTSTPWRSLTSTNTANGWHAIDDILNLLIYPTVVVSWSSKGETNVKSGNNNIQDADSNETNRDWDLVTAYWENNSQGGSANNLPPQKYTFAVVLTKLQNFSTEHVCEYRPHFQTVFSYPVITLATSATNYTSNLEYYGEAYSVSVGMAYSSWAGDGTNWFDSQGSGFNRGVNLMLSEANIATVGTWTNTVSIGDTNRTVGTWCPAPDGGSNSVAVIAADYFPIQQAIDNRPVSSLGYRVDSTRVLADYISSSSPITYYAD